MADARVRSPLADRVADLATIGAEFGVAFEDQRRFETAYRDEARFRSLVQNSSESITVIDAAGIVRYHSQAAQRVFGDDPEKVLGTRWIDILHDEDRAQASALLAEVAANSSATARPSDSMSTSWRRVFVPPMSPATMRIAPILRRKMSRPNEVRTGLVVDRLEDEW